MLVNGRDIAEKILKELEGKPEKRVCFLSFNESDAGKSFVSIKVKTAERLGIEYERISQKTHSTEEAVRVVGDLSKRDFDGLIVQLPLGKGIDTNVVLNSIPADIDIDVLGEKAKRNFREDRTKRVPPVAGAVQEILKAYKVDLEGKEILILGRGRLVGEPVSVLFDRLGQRYKVADKLTPRDELMSNIKEADVLISGIGVPHFVKPDMIKEGAVLIDAGTSTDNGKVAGDIYPSCEAKASLFTPVPGGVGPVTVAVLFSNLYKL